MSCRADDAPAGQWKPAWQLPAGAESAVESQYSDGVHAVSTLSPAAAQYVPVGHANAADKPV